MRFIRTRLSRNGKPLDFAAVEPKVQKLCQKFRINLFYIFGSYASGKAGPLSDIDVAYLSPTKIDALTFLQILQDIFEEEAIDLVDLRQAPPSLMHRILKYGRCLYAKDIKIKIAFETRAEGEYYDTAPLRRTYFYYMMERIKHGTFGTG